MTAKEMEDLFLRSLDQSLDESEREKLMKALDANPGLRKDMEQYDQIRESLLRRTPATFGPYFAQKVIARIQTASLEIDSQIVFFFKKYQMAALGVLFALLAMNVIFADQLNISSVLGVQEEEIAADDEIETFDFQNKLTDN